MENLTIRICAGSVPTREPQSVGHRIEIEELPFTMQQHRKPELKGDPE
jgi:hypothetical protein